MRGNKRPMDLSRPPDRDETPIPWTSTKVGPASALRAGESVGAALGEDEVAEFQVFRPAARGTFEVERIDSGGFRVSGDAVERLIARHDLENEEALAHVEHRLRRMGVITALEKEGFEPGDDVEIAGIVFELDPGAPF